MASYNADIELRLRTEALDKQLKKIEQQIGKISASGKSVPKALTAEYNKLTRGLDAATAEVIKRGKAEEVNTRELKKQSAELRKQKASRAKGRQSAALGVGFPLLFGGGAGSIAGGLLGSAGGFGGQILGSAVGQQVDQFASKLVGLAGALDGAGGSTQALETLLGDLDSETRRRIQNLEKSGQSALAADAAFQKLSDEIGDDLAKVAVLAGQDLNALGNQVTKFFTILGVSIASLFQETFFLNARDPLEGVPEVSPETAVARVTSGEALKVARAELELAEAKLAKDQEAAFAAEKKLINLEKAKALSEITRQIQDGSLDAQIGENKQREIELQARSKTADLATRTAAADERSARAAERAAAEARREADKVKREADAASRKLDERQKKINSAAVSLIDVSVEARKLDAGRLAAIDRELQLIGRKQGFIEQNIKLSEKDLQTQQMLLDASRQKMRNKERELELERARIKLAQESQLIDTRRSGEDFRRGIANESAGIALSLQDPFGTSQQVQEQVLALEQMERRTAALLPLQRELNDLERAAQEFKGKEDIQAAENRQVRIDELNAIIQKNSEALAGLEQLELAQSRYNQVLEAAQPFADAFASGLLDGITGIVEGTKTAEQAFADFLNNIAKMLMQTAQQMIAQYIALGIARTFATGGGGGDIFSQIASRGGLRAADGAAFGKNNILPFAKGGIVNKPTMFAYGDGGAGRFGLMGEAGPEAILPLKRGPGGRLGVESSGGVGNVVVNVDASGSQVQGDSSSASQLGKVIGAAVQSELIKQKRPGGLLAT